MEQRIKDVWFGKNRIWMLDTEGVTHSRPLEAFPTLKLASDEQRADFFIHLGGTALRWPQIDEDIHVSSFYEEGEPQPDNEIASIFKRFPELNPMKVAEAMGVHYSLLYRFIYGMLTPSAKRREELTNALHTLGSQLMEVQV